MVTAIKKRLYRDPDHRVVGGVASGLAAYFNTEVWIPRVIFCLPLIAGTLASFFRHTFFDFEGPVFFVGGFGGALFTTYIILWIVLPEATTASEKLEMRGEKIDLASIKNTIKNDLEGFKQKATVVGSEVKARAEQFGNEIKNKSNGPRQGIGHAIGVLFKAFFLFISVIVTFALVMALIGIIFTGAGVMPLKNYFFSGFWENILVWAVLLLFLVLPVVGLLTWLIRRIIGARKGSNYLGYTFGSLWSIGLICLIILVANVSAHFRTRNGLQETIEMNAPSKGKLIVKVDDSKPIFSDSDWMGVNWHHKGPFFDINEDSVVINTVRIDVVKSKDTAWHVRREKMSRGPNSENALSLAEQIQFPIVQEDSVLLLSRGFAIRPAQQFHNQQVLVVIEVPVGKKIMMNRSLDDYHWFNMRGRNQGYNINIEYDDDRADSWDSEVEYVMTENGLERTGRSSYDNEEQPEHKERKESPERKEAPERSEGADSVNQKNDNPKGEYRYHKSKTANLVPAQTTPTLVLLTELI